MKPLLLVVLLSQGALGCLPARPRSFQNAAPTVQFSQNAQQPVWWNGQQWVSGGGGPRVAAAGPGPHSPIAAQGSALESVLGNRVSLAEFSADGYNSEGGGPVNSGSALTCNFDGRPCCWANVPPPDDQLDWQIATGAADPAKIANAPRINGSYLVAYARAAAPSDEAQFASCSVGCASSPITVRAKHWQSENVLLQVCLRESFPNNADHNPLLNCQEFPLVSTITTTELILPKTSLVDIVFVASNFVGEQGDMAILDDIEVSYDRNGPECQKEDSGELQQGAAHRQTVETRKHQTATYNKKQPEAVDEHLENLRENENTLKKVQGGAGEEREGNLVSAVEKFGKKGFQGGQAAFGEKAFKGVDAAANGEQVEPSVIESTKTAGRINGQPVAKGAKTLEFSESICQTTKCDFENGNTCSYKDAHQTQSIRGLTTKFEVVNGQFMNRVTGVKESFEGDFYAATFLFPREMAGLEATTEPFTEKSRIRFQYYEGTHGVQLKGCCNNIDSCPFSSDKFVSVSDRVWKTASFKCPKGTDKVIFLCENTRTNQGACAVDNMGLVESDGSIQDVRPLC